MSMALLLVFLGILSTDEKWASKAGRIVVGF